LKPGIKQLVLLINGLKLLLRRSTGVYRIKLFFSSTMMLRRSKAERLFFLNHFQPSLILASEA